MADQGDLHHPVPVQANAVHPTGLFLVDGPPFDVGSVALVPPVPPAFRGHRLELFDIDVLHGQDVQTAILAFIHGEVQRRVHVIHATGLVSQVITNGGLDAAGNIVREIHMGRQMITGLMGFYIAGVGIRQVTSMVISTMSLTGLRLIGCLYDGQNSLTADGTVHVVLACNPLDFILVDEAEAEAAEDVEAEDSDGDGEAEDNDGEEA